MTFDRPTDPAQTPRPDDPDATHGPSDVEPAASDVPPPAEAVEPAWPSEPAQPDEPYEASEPVAAAEPVPPVQPTQPVEPTEPVAPVAAVTPVEPVQATQPIPPVEPEPEPVAVAPVQPAASQVNVNAAPVAAATVDTGPGPLYWARRVLSLLFAILFVLIGVRIFLLLLVADPSNNIVDFVYSVTEPFVAPFRGMFQFDEVTAGDRTLDVAALAALIGWLLIYVLIMAILRMGDRRRA